MQANNISATRVKTMCMELSEKSHTDSKRKGKADNVQCYEISALMKNGVVNLIAHL